MTTKLFKDVLLVNHFISLDEYEEVMTIHLETKKSFVEALVSNGYLTIQQLALILDTYYQIKYMELSEEIINEAATGLLDYHTAMKYNVIPVDMKDNTIFLAMSDPFHIEAIDDVSIITGYHVQVYFVHYEDIKYFINKFYRSIQITSIASQFLVDENLKNNEYSMDLKFKTDIQNAPAVKLIDSVIESAVLYHASDIHIEPFEKIVRTRYRIDGQLIEFQSVDISLHSYIISRLKIMSGIDISNKRLPQDGHFNITVNHLKIDFRLSTIPTIFGEKAVIRLIYTQSNKLDKTNLGFFPEDIEKISRMFKNPHGAILVTGPTGSGKTTTLVSFINSLNKENINIVTIEDPVENIVYGVNQINVNPKAGLEFSTALRSILRQDPDIIMVGEIRDSETAKIAIRAAITGHLVLSTLHTNDALSAITRLIDMGVEDYLVTSAVKGILSQRLVRRICPDCKKETTISKKDAGILQLSEDTRIFRAVGCQKCNKTGYRGRFAIYELLEIDSTIRELVEKKYSNKDMKEYLIKKNSETIWDNAKKNVVLGNTTVEEMYKAVFTY